jgi:transglutaminase-like putative cysteine protease
MISVRVLSCIALLAFTLAAGQTDFSVLAQSETLAVFVKDIPVGTLTSTTTVSDTITVKNRLEIEQSAMQSLDAITMEETTRYTGSGEMIRKSQFLSGAGGTNTWEAIAGRDNTSLTVTTAGVANTRKIGPSRDNLSAMLRLYQGIRDRILSAGTQWSDTALELTSGKNVVTVMRCVAAPSAANGWVWTITTADNVTRRDLRWELDTAGHTILQEIPPLFTAKRMPGKYAKTDSSASGRSADFLDMSKIAVARKADRPEKIRVSIDTPATMDASVRGLYHRDVKGGWILSPQTEDCRSAKRAPDSLVRAFAIPTATMQSDDDSIAALSGRLAKRQKVPCEIISTMNRHVYETIRKRNTSTFSSALETLRSGFGDCGEHAVLLGALLRAAGIPARIVYGLVYSEAHHGYYYHAWVLAYSGRDWLFADPSHGIFPAPRDRVPLVIDDNGEKLMNLGTIIERLHISYVR